jgi:hypothetical protein
MNTADAVRDRFAGLLCLFIKQSHGGFWRMFISG